ncbi:hypothetical protein VB712_12070 [Spirulina sp. CCNP1310]|uniref:hypothetical protein n=1 Tax=Spirulina sp. CCNP1310 TaxID=3110249 RepID=UPI002B21A400|nr:hypothetical protein [Spirulina sp. CCNP1310]MEA5419959.1 hypothetical protein [Spirulina sp. CCNP1310]
MSQDPKPVTLHPTLEAALGCLDVDVDRELARYRRQRQQHEPAATTTAVAIAAPAPIPAPSQDHDIANYTQPPRPPAEGQSPQTYLQSSEQLLNTLKQDDSPGTPAAKSAKKRGLSPLALGAMGLGVLTVALLGWAFYGPDPFAPEPISETPLAPTESPSSSRELDANGAPLNLDGPDLATEETPTTSALPAPEPEAGEPAPAPSPAIPGRPSDLTSALLPDPNSPIPAPEPSPTPAAPPRETIPNVATAPPSNDPYYYVLVGYDGEASLREARGAIPDAYVRQFPQGIRIQMGAFDNAADAQRLANALQSRGLVGEVHQGPD